jgi:hypothetical protein
MPIATMQDVEAFVAKLAPKLNAGTTLEIMVGPKNFRLVSVSPGSRYVYCFIEAATGDILKSASWKAPAKGVRGNIFGDDPTSCCDWYGAQYWSPGRKKAA